MARNPFRRLYEVLAGASHSELRRQVQFLKAENEILRRHLPGRVRPTPAERTRLVRLGKPLGKAVRELVTIVHPETFARWVRASRKRRTIKRRGSRPGRPRTALEIRAVILRIARETDWGYTRILGELKKLGITVSRSTVVNVLREADLPTAPDRSESPWHQFIARHAKTLWACDFVSHRVLTPKGWAEAFVLVFIHLATRRVHVSGSTLRPDAEWVSEQARDFAAAARPPAKADRRKKKAKGKPPRPILIHDRDGKLGRAFDAALAAEGIRPHPIPCRAPNLNARCERFIQSLQQECLDRFVVVGTRHLDHLVSEYAAYHNAERPHSALGFRTPTGPPAVGGTEPIGPRNVRCTTRLGGVLRHYHRRAA